VNIVHVIVRSNATPARTADHSVFMNIVVTPLNTCSHWPDSGPYFVLHESSLYTHPFSYALIALLNKWAQIKKRK